ncbi:MAG TPA: hypothetical protein VIY27_00740 [Myxococcota bacterium]
MPDERAEDSQADREMSEAPPGSDAELQQEEEDASSPFDHPAFLPVILVAVALWFGYDGWFNTEIESVRFNRYGFGFLIGAALYFTLEELARLPYLTALLFLGYALWLGGLSLLGSPDVWYNDEPSVQLFNRWAARGFLVLAAFSALRETWRRRRARGA